MVTVGLITNPTSGHGRARSEITRIIRRLRDHHLTVIDATADSYDTTHHAAHALARQGISALITVGGDGMVHLGVDCVVGTSLPLGIIPLGSGNDVARHFSLPQRVDDAVDLIAHALNNPHECIVSTDVIESTHPDGTPLQRGHQFSMAIVSAGIDASINARANAMRWPRQSGRYVRAVMEELTRIHTYGYSITTDHSAFTGKALVVSVANTRFFGGGMDVVPHADPHDGLLDIIRIDPVSAYEAFRVFPRIFSGGHITHPAVHVERTRQVLIEYATGPDPQHPWACPPCPHADGEALTDLPLLIRCCPQSVHVIVPPGYQST